MPWPQPSSSLHDRLGSSRAKPSHGMTHGSVLYDPERHEPVAEAVWSEPRARDAIAAICRDVEAAFEGDRLWPMHPDDFEPGTPADGILRGLYVGAAGVLHALGRL